MPKAGSKHVRQRPALGSAPGPGPRPLAVPVALPLALGLALAGFREPGPKLSWGQNRRQSEDESQGVWPGPGLRMQQVPGSDPGCGPDPGFGLGLGAGSGPDSGPSSSLAVAPNLACASRKIDFGGRGGSEPLSRTHPHPAVGGSEGRSPSGLSGVWGCEGLLPLEPRNSPLPAPCSSHAGTPTLYPVLTRCCQAGARRAGPWSPFLMPFG